MKKKEEIMMEHCSDNGLLSMALGKSILAAMEEYAQQQVKNCNTPAVSARAFVESCGTITEYVNGAKVAHRFRKFTVPVIEYNELRKAADDWDLEHVR